MQWAVDNTPPIAAHPRPDSTPGMCLSTASITLPVAETADPPCLDASRTVSHGPVLDQPGVPAAGSDSEGADPPPPPIDGLPQYCQFTFTYPVPLVGTV